MMKKGFLFTKGTPQEVFNYQNIEDVYKTVVLTKTNPLSGKPAIFLISNRVLSKFNQDNNTKK